MDLISAEMLLLIVIVFVALGVGTAMGFGSMVITIVLASHFFEIPFLLGVMVPVNLLISVYVVVRYRRHVRWRFLWLKVLPAMGLGSIVGFALFAFQDSRGLQMMFGALVLGLAVMELWGMYRKAESRPLPGWLNLLALGGAGVIHGLFASGGPLAVYAISRKLRSKEEFRATLCALWTVLNFGLIAVYVPSGVATIDTAVVSAVLLLSVAGGIVVGEWVHKILVGAWFRGTVFVLLAGGALALLARTAVQ
jgi:uncharacterized membrane protein YfcA